MNINLLEQYLKSPEYLKLAEEKLFFLQEIFTNNPEIKLKWKQILKNDIVEFAKKCLVIYEPRSTIKNIIFNPFPYQIEIWKKLDEVYNNGRGEILIEKSRDMGITYTVLAWIFHKWLTIPNFSALIGSRKESEVDNKTINSLFGKIRFFLYHMPHNLFLSYKTFKRKIHDNHLKLINPKMNSIIEGESSNPNFGRGKRASVLFCDELFFWPYLEESIQSIYDVSPIRIYVSTPTTTTFAKNFVENLRKNNNVFTIHWKEHPFKDDEWYKEEIKSRSVIESSILSEIELSYDIGLENAYYPEAFSCKTEPLDYDPSLPLYIGLDTASASQYSDYTAIIWAQIYGDQLRVLEALLTHGRLVEGFNQIDWFLPYFSPRIPIQFDKNYYQDWEYDVLLKVRTWHEPDIICGELNLRSSQQVSGMSWESYLIKSFKKYNVETKIIINTQANSYEARRASVSKFILSTVFNNKSSNALKVLEALKSTTKVYVKKGASVKVEPSFIKGYKDLRAAFENLCTVLEKIKFGGFRIIEYARKI